MVEVSRPALFLDRDGVINVDHGYVYRPEDCEFVPGIFSLVARANQLGFRVLVVTNQSGIARGYYDEAAFQDFCRWQQAQFAAQGAHIDHFFFCPHHPEGKVAAYAQRCDCRKPGSGMFRQAGEQFAIDLARSVMVGDKPIDMEAALGAGVGRGFMLADPSSPQPVFGHVVGSLADVEAALIPSA